MAERKVEQVAKEKTKQYRFVGSHADTLANGRPVEPGEFVDLTDEQAEEPHNKMLLDDGNLIFIGEDAKPQEIATPEAKELARQHRIDLAMVPATGATGLVTKGDVEAYIAKQNNGEES